MLVPSPPLQCRSEIPKEFCLLTSGSMMCTVWSDAGEMGQETPCQSPSSCTCSCSMSALPVFYNMSGPFLHVCFVWVFFPNDLRLLQMLVQEPESFHQSLWRSSLMSWNTKSWLQILLLHLISMEICL